MKKDSVKSIEKCVAQKVKHFSEFSKLTDKIYKADFDSLAELIAKRQVQISEIDSISNEIKIILENFSKENQDTIQSILDFKYEGHSTEFSGLISQTKELETLLISIMEKEFLAKTRMDTLRFELENQTQKLTKSKNTFDYVNTFASFNSNGTNFDSLT